MKTKSLIKATLLAGIAFAATQASAATYFLNLTGTVSNSTFNSFSFGGSTYNTWNLALDGTSPIQLNQGDIIKATVTLDSSFTVPATGEMFIGFNLLQNPGNNQTTLPATTNGDITFFNSGSTGLVNDTVPGGCGNCLSDIVFLGNHGPVSFNSIFADFTINTLTDSNFLINDTSLSYQLRDPFTGGVPEPASWALLLAGFGLTGAAMRRRAKVLVTFA